MSLADLLARLHVAQFDVDAGQVLDALWLASQARGLSLHAGAEAPPVAPAPASAPRQDSQTDKVQKDNQGKRPAPLPAPLARHADVDIFPAIGQLPSPTTVRASPVTLPAPRALENRLALMRALRPLSQRWPSHQYAQIDEERTAQSCIRVGANNMHLMVPVFKPQRERWFDVELVLEDEPSAELWHDMLSEFAEMLRQTGAFGRVRQWRLRFDDKGGPAHLENAYGSGATAGSLLGKAARRLLIFASTGASRRWTDGSNAKVLAPWMGDNCVVLLQLTAPERWARSAIGEPQALASTTTAGAQAGALNVEAHWWKMGQQGEPAETLPLPVITLTPGALAQWANMQMARGRSSPAYLMSVAGAANAGEGDLVPEPDVSRAVALLKYESPEIFKLAVLLCTGPFTLTVARLVQAIKFAGNTDPGMLAELIRCGLVVPQTAGTPSDTPYFAVRPVARDLLLRSLRDSEATQLARELQRQVSQQVSSFAGSGVQSAQLIADEDGKHHLPEWAKPFASLATSLLGLPQDAHAARQQLADFLSSIDQPTVQAIARLAATSQAVSPSAFVPAIWERLLTARLVYRRDDGTWAFAPHIRSLLANQQALPTGDDGEWLEAALAVLQSMAQAFYGGHLMGDGDGSGRMRDELRSWMSDRVAALEHILFKVAHVFWGSVRTVLITGEDPFQHRDLVADRAAFDKYLADLRDWAHDAGSSRRSAVPWAVRNITNAVRLLDAREPERLEELAPFDMSDQVQAFIAPSSSYFAGDGATAGHDAEMALLKWLHTDEVATALAPYCSIFYNRFAADGMSEFALADNYADYIAGLIDVWAEVVEHIFSHHNPSALVMKDAVSVDSLTQVMRRFPHHGIALSTDIPRQDLRETGEGLRKWTIPPDSYHLLIGALGTVVVQALQSRLAFGPRRPRVLWVDDEPDNNTTERKYDLAEGNVEYTLATTTEEGLACTRDALFDVVISDMGRVGDRHAGYTLLEALRRDGNKVPFVIYSSRSRPQDDDEARRRGAVGRTGWSPKLPVLFLKAVMARQAVLDRPVSVRSLVQYAAWRFPEKKQNPELAEYLAPRLDPMKYPTLLDVDRAVTPASGAMKVFAASNEGYSDTDTGMLFVALLLSDPVLRTPFLGGETWAMLEKYLPLLVPEAAPKVMVEAYDADSSALIEQLDEHVRAGRLPSIRQQIEAALNKTINSADWIVQASSYMTYETEDEQGVLLGWNFPSQGSWFEAIGNELGTLHATSTLDIEVEVRCTFQFSAQGSSGESLGSLGYLHARRKVRFRADAELVFSGLATSSPTLDLVEFEHIVEHVDFGNVEAPLEGDGSM